MNSIQEHDEAQDPQLELWGLQSNEESQDEVLDLETDDKPKRESSLINGYRLRQLMSFNQEAAQMIEDQVLPLAKEVVASNKGITVEEDRKENFYLLLIIYHAILPVSNVLIKTLSNDLSSFTFVESGLFFVVAAIILHYRLYLNLPIEFFGGEEFLGRYQTYTYEYSTSLDKRTMTSSSAYVHQKVGVYNQNIEGMTEDLRENERQFYQYLEALGLSNLHDSTLVGSNDFAEQFLQEFQTIREEIEVEDIQRRANLSE